MNPEQEGVIKYQLDYRHQKLDEKLAMTQLNAWRHIMYRLQLIGQHQSRYQGYGFGNISQRHSSYHSQFLISGTQTGHLADLTSDDYCLITEADPQANRITATGPCKPSSEALTHANIYLQNKKIQGIIHVHCPEIWHHTQHLKLAHTLTSVAYGTPEMAGAVEQLFQQHTWGDQTIFTMLGHEDGVVAFGENLQQAAMVLINCLSLAISLKLRN